MAWVYEDIIIGNKLDVKSNGRVITETKGDIVTDDGNHTVRFPVGTDGQAIVADSTQATGLAWKTLTAADVGLDAGNGLVLTGNTLNVGGSSTIISNADTLEVNSSGTANQVLLSSGTIGTSASYGALPLNDTNSVTGILPIANGGTNTSSFAAANRLIATNGSNNTLVTTTLDPSTVVTTTDTQTLTNKTLDTPIIINSINDANGNELVDFVSTPSAVNEISVQNAATGEAPTITVAGDDTNIDLNITAKGTGNVSISSLKFPNSDGTTGQVLSTDGTGTLQFIDVPVVAIGTVQTTDATETNVPSLTISTSADTLYLVEAKFLAKEVGGSNIASFVIKTTFYNTGGVLNHIGTDLVYIPISTTWIARVIPDSTNIVFQVTGENSTTISWKVSVNVMTI